MEAINPAGISCFLEQCIYNSQYKCLFEKIEINDFGMCADCILVSLDPNFLETKKVQERMEITARLTKAEACFPT